MSAEIRKRKKGQILNTNERQLILNLINYIKGKHADKSISEVIREVSKATGCSERTVYKIRKDASRGIINSTAKTRFRKKENKNSRNIKYDSFVKSSIRKKIHNLFLQGVAPTLNGILSLVNKDPQLPNLKRSTLHTLLKEIGFNYEQIGKKPLLIERSDLIKCRQEYIRNIEKFRKENRGIVYTGGTMICCLKEDLPRSIDNNKDNSKLLKVCEDDSGQPLTTYNTLNAIFFTAPPQILSETTLIYTIDSSIFANSHSNTFISFNGGETNVQKISPDSNNDNIETKKNQTLPKKTALDVSDASKSSVKESRDDLHLKVLHACNDEGFLQGVELVSLCKKKTEEIDCYENWFIKKLLPKIPPDSVIVTDTNSYFYQKKNENHQVPNSTWKKQRIKNWLLQENISIGDKNHKKDLLSLVGNIRPFSCDMKSKITQLANEKGVKIISLPPFHYELNPLNMVWHQIKSHVKYNLKGLGAKKIKESIKEGMHSISQSNWINYINEVKKTEEMLQSMDQFENAKTKMCCK